ncbi:outer membrane lipoprotein YmcA [Vibrio sp. JCM 19236]|nr:outer membrane lipoprotein YmcA [Vibrio sp. JCM 19236]
MNNLQLTWFEDFGDNWFFQGYGGYLETMFAGAGAEVLYRPVNASWAIGADFTFISQRDPESWFGVFEESRQFSEADQRYYNVVDKGTTGFLTAYYMPQWSWLDDTLLKVGAGEFLAGDIGARIDFSKQFDSGVIAGVFASITDLTPEEYGEGSFTKGFYISVPFDVMTVKPSGNRASFSWQPITRDGGQMLKRKYQLFDVTDARSPWYQRPAQRNTP